MEHLRINDFLRLEKIKLSDAPSIFKVIDRDREYLKTWLPFVEMTQHISDSEKFIRGVIDEPGCRNNELYTIWWKEEFAGLIGLHQIDRANKKTEIGYWLAEKMQGKGLIAKSIDKLIRYAFQKLKLNRVEIKVAVGNEKSAKIPKRHGFTYEGIERDGELHGTTFYDLETYSLLRRDLS